MPKLQGYNPNYYGRFFRGIKVQGVNHIHAEFLISTPGGV